MAKMIAQLDSAALREAMYDDARMELDIIFNDGRSYTYEGVPLKVFEELRDAASPGSYYWSNIRNTY